MSRAVAAVLIPAAFAAGQAAEFHGLGVVAPGPFEQVGPPIPKGVSADGSVVCGYVPVNDPVHATTTTVAARWTLAGGWTQITDVGYSGAAAISGDGLTIGGFGQFVLTPPPGMFRPFLLRAGAGTVWPGPDLATVEGLSWDGSVAAIWVQGAAGRRWTTSGSTELGHIAGWGGTQGAPTAICADGLVIAGADAAGTVPQAFRWTQATGMQGLGFLATMPQFQASFGYGLSADGTTVVGSARTDSGGWVPFYWRAPGGIRALPTLNGYPEGSALATSADGSMIVGQADGATGSVAYSWDRVRGRRELRQLLISLGANLTGWTPQSAAAISPDGAWIVGVGTGPGAAEQGWIARIPAFCYANCDASVAAPRLNVQDFTCFLNRFAVGDPYANCDDSTSPPALNVADFSCFLNRFVAGCS